MKRVCLIIYVLLSLVIASCKSSVENVVIAGYITAGSDETAIIITHPDSTLPTRIALTESTTFLGGDIVVGNIAEVIYIPNQPRDVVLPKALQVTADKTFPRAIGRWASRETHRPRINIELLNDGSIAQTSPEETLTYTNWQLTGEENVIKLYGTLSLPPVKSKKEKSKKTASDEEVAPPPRRLMSFCVTAEIGAEGDRRTLTITSSKGSKSKLYFIEEPASVTP